MLYYIMFDLLVFSLGRQDFSCWILWYTEASQVSIHKMRLKHMIFVRVKTDFYSLSFLCPYWIWLICLMCLAKLLFCQSVLNMRRDILYEYYVWFCHEIIRILLLFDLGIFLMSVYFFYWEKECKNSNLRINDWHLCKNSNFRIDDSHFHVVEIIYIWFCWICTDLLFFVKLMTYSLCMTITKCT